MITQLKRLSKKRAVRFLCLPILILWLAFGLRLYQLDLQSLWWDEGHSIFVASHPVADIPTLPAMDVHPPAYFALLHLWMEGVGQSEFALRYLSVLFSMVTVALLWRFGAETGRIDVSLLAAILATISPVQIAYAQEIRSYALITCLATISNFILWQMITSQVIKTKHFLAYILWTTVALYTHYFTIFLLLFQNLVWLWWSGWQKERWKVWFGSQGAILIGFSFQVGLAFRQVNDYTNPNLNPPSLIDFISRSWQAYTVGLTITPESARWGMGALAIILILYLFRLSKSSSKKFIGFLTAWFLIPLIAYFLVLQNQPSFEPRYVMFVTPALFLLLALAPSLLRYHLSLIPIIVFLFALHHYYTDETYFKDDSVGVASWLATETTANDIIYIDVPHPFHYYVERYQIAAPTQYLFVDIHTAAEKLSREAIGKDRLFWITWRGSDTDPRGVIPFLAEKYGRQAGQQQFRGYQVDWFTLPANLTTFELPQKLSPLGAIFGEVLHLDGAAYPHQLRSDQSIWVTLHFTLLQSTEVNYKVSLRLRAEDGSLVAQIDKILLNDRHFQTADWPVDDPALNQAVNVYILPTDNLTPGLYSLEVVVYNADPPYPSEGVRDIETPDGISAKLGTITVIP